MIRPHARCAPYCLGFAAIAVSLTFLLLSRSWAQTPAARPAASASKPAQVSTDFDLRSRDYHRMLDVLHLKLPTTLPAAEDDPNRPVNSHRNNNGRWTDDAGNSETRSIWGTWNNFDEAKANPYPIPDALLLKNGRRTADAQTWWNQRRPEILNDFQAEVYGRIPRSTPTVSWEVAATNSHAYGGKVIVKSMVGHIDNSTYPAAHPVLKLTTYVPTDAKGPVPMMVILTPGSPAGNHAASTQQTLQGAMQQLLSIGWGYAAFETSAVQADNAEGLYSGIIGLMNKGQPRQPDDWGVLAAWSWGLSRAIDYLETDKSVDARHLGVEGHSRWGKGAMVAAAYEPRWAICFASCSGEGGAKLSRRNYGETLDDVAGMGEYHWMAGNFLKYAGHWNDLPVDSHELMALIAPRPLFITGGTQDRWADPHGEFLATVAAGSVYELLGKTGLGTALMPAPDAELISGDIAFRYHAGGHTDALDWPTFLKFAQREFHISGQGKP